MEGKLSGVAESDSEQAAFLDSTGERAEPGAQAVQGCRHVGQATKALA
jgi:hypothetical protein